MSQEERDIQILDRQGGVTRCHDLAEFLRDNRVGFNSRETLAQTLEQKKAYLRSLEVPEFHLMTVSEQAEVIGVVDSTIRNWSRRVPAEIMAEALRKSRESSAGLSLKVDAALAREATREGGDAKHKELYYKRMENWAPQQAIELSRGKDREIQETSTVELVKGLLGTLTPEQKKELLRDTKCVEDEIINSMGGK